MRAKKPNIQRGMSGPHSRMTSSSQLASTATDNGADASFRDYLLAAAIIVCPFLIVSVFTASPAPKRIYRYEIEGSAYTSDVSMTAARSLAAHARRIQITNTEFEQAQNT